MSAFVNKQKGIHSVSVQSNLQVRLSLNHASFTKHVLMVPKMY